MNTRILPLCLLSLGLAACSGSGDDDTNIPPGPPAPRNVDPIAGGGTSGGRIDGVLTVFVQDQDNMPIADADVLVVQDTARFIAKTDAEGRVDFNEPGIDGSLSLHIFKDGFQYNSIYGFDASVVTIALSDGVAEEPAAGLVGTVTGTITGWDNLPPNTMTAARVAQVEALGNDLDDVMQMARPGTVTPGDPDGTDYNTVINGTDPFPTWTDYSLRADTRASKVYALAGSYNLTTAAFEITHVGVADVTITEGQSSMANLALDNALDQELSVTTPGLPMLDSSVAFFGVTFTDEDITLPLAFGELTGTMATAQGPSLSGGLADAVYTVGVQVTSTETVKDEPKSSVVAIARGTGKTFTLENVLSPPAAPTVTGRTMGTMPVSGASLTVFDLRTSDDDKSLWNIIVLGDKTTIEVPAVPDGLTDPLMGSRVLGASVLDFGDVDLNDTAFENLEDQVRSTASTRAEVNL